MLGRQYSVLTQPEQLKLDVVLHPQSSNLGSTGDGLFNIDPLTNILTASSLVIPASWSC